MNFTIKDIIDTLNLIEVKGKANLDRLLTAIMCLEAVVQAAEDKDEAQDEDVPTDSSSEEVKIYADEE